MPHALGHSLRRLLLATAIGAPLAFAPSAEALTTFGTNLSRPATNGIDCGGLPGPYGLDPVTLAGFVHIVYPSNQTNCTWSATGRNLGTQENSLVPPGIGTIVRVRVRVGAIAGPMQVVVLRAIRSVVGVVNPNPAGETPGAPGVNVACCKEAGRSAIFTPAPNAVTTVAMALPVRSDILPNPLTQAVEFDTLGLSVLAPGVPVPAQDTGEWQNPDNINGSLTAGYYPAWRPGEERANAAGILGYQVLLQADWEPIAGGNANSGAVVTLVQPVARLRGNVLSFGLRCNQATPCIGTVLIQNRAGQAANVAALRALNAPNRRAAEAAAKKSRTITVARSKLNIPAGATKTVSAKLTKRGKRLVRRQKKFYVNLKIGKTQLAAGSIKVKKSKKR
ncbi:MAG: hypothetical protein WDZ37_07105 [Solirubrobacterales bacterium]